MRPTRREDLPAAEGVDVARQVKTGTAAAAFTVLVLAAMALVLLLATRFRVTWDFTRQGANSLSPKTQEALGALDEPVSIHGLFRDNDRRREMYWELLQRYRRASRLVTAEIFDPNTRPGDLEALELAAVDRDTIKNGVSVAISGSRKTIFRGVTEEDVTNAILETGQSAPRVVGVLRGYGERDVDSTSDAGMARARDALKQEYYRLADVRLDVPISPDVTALLVPGARTEITRADLDRLSAWVDAGGRLLVLADPEHRTGLEAITGRFGLTTGDVKVVDRRQGLRGQPEVPLVNAFTKHPIVRGFGPAMPLAFPLPTAVETFESEDPAVYREALVRTSAFSEGLSHTGARAQGPFALAAAAWKPAPPNAPAGTAETRLVLVGDVAFATNAFLGESANRDFLLNCIGWLTRARGQVTVRPAPLQGQMLRLTPGEGALFQVIAGAPPFLVIAVGVFVYVRRRRL